MERVVKTGTYNRNGNDYTFNFWTDISSADKISFIKNIIFNILDDNYYYPMIRDAVFDFEIIRMFTDVDTSEINESSDVIGNIEEFLNETNVVEIVKSNAAEGLIDELNKAVDDNIEYRTGIHKNVIAESLSQLIKTVERKVSEIDTESMINVAQMLSDISGELTAENFVNAYTKSDIFTKNLEERLNNRR